MNEAQSIASGNERPELSLVIPCYNEESTLENCVARCLKLEEHGVSLEIIIVDDHSADKSPEIAEKICERHKVVKYFRQPRNMGKGRALRTGFEMASGKFVGVQDADSEYEPLDYIQLLKPLNSGVADVVYGSRYLRRNTRRVLYFWHTWMNRSLTFVSNMFTNLDVTDMETCYKVFTSDAIKELAPLLREDRFGFEPEITALVARKKLRVYECAIHYHPRTYEEGKKIGWRDGVRALYCILHYGAPYAPLPMQLLLYFFIGLICAVTNVVGFAILDSLDLSLFPAVTLAFAASAALNYYLCVTILFSAKEKTVQWRELGLYVICVLVMCALDYLVTYFLISAGLTSVWGKIWGATVGFFGNFYLRKYVIFK